MAAWASKQVNMIGGSHGDSLIKVHTLLFLNLFLIPIFQTVMMQKLLPVAMDSVYHRMMCATWWMTAGT